MENIKTKVDKHTSWTITVYMSQSTRTMKSLISRLTATKSIKFIGINVSKEDDHTNVFWQGINVKILSNEIPAARLIDHIIADHMDWWDKPEELWQTEFIKKIDLEIKAWDMYGDKQ